MTSPRPPALPPRIANIEINSPVMYAGTRFVFRSARLLQLLLISKRTKPTMRMSSRGPEESWPPLQKGRKFQRTKLNSLPPPSRSILRSFADLLRNISFLKGRFASTWFFLSFLTTVRVVWLEDRYMCNDTRVSWTHTFTS